MTNITITYSAKLSQVIFQDKFTLAKLCVENVPEHCARLMEQFVTSIINQRSAKEVKILLDKITSSEINVFFKTFLFFWLRDQMNRASYVEKFYLKAIIDVLDFN